ncbi:hypothetical protein PGT21_024673 [Puccinia graminis f. sp. tritici]|uniref:Uncharacterized protein n=1 Tax=Puccinia graminis f. sp. tritici TaxID=56615 RepID=A0A5B0S123_PUCGR|nr:hypothetical protein PGT21_024673 [Puccinia graminis f. sp. tritici]KAA1131750.1 hypothetical protein PGTUg99_020178 [Puccinia graminis f. sp. tritici]
MNRIHICFFFFCLILLVTTGNSYSSETEIKDQAGGRRLTTTTATTRMEEQTQEPSLDQQQQKTLQEQEQLEPADELNHSSSSSSSQNERGRLDGHSSSSKQTLINFSSASADPLGHLQSSSRPLPSAKPKKKTLFFAASLQKFFRSLFVLFTTRNPIWSLSFMLVKSIFSYSFRIFYATVSALFGFLTHLMVWFWDEILFPMTYPIRLVFWMLITQPLNLSKTILKKLKPVILFLLSAIGLGVMIGMVGSSTHLRIGNWLFPLHHSHTADKKNKKTRKSRMLGSSDRGLAKRPETDALASHTPSPQPHRRPEEIPRPEKKDKKKQAGSNKSRPPPEADDLTMPEEEEEGDWMSSKRETELSSALEPNQTRYTSAVHQNLFSQPSSSARHRHLPHHPSSSDGEDDDDPPVSSSLSPASSAALTSPPKPPHHSWSSTTAGADSISILKSSPPPQNSSSSTSFTPSRKKKVTFKTD